MLTLRLFTSALAVLIGAGTLAATAAGAPKEGCPVGTGWNEMTVEDVAARVWPALLDQSPWADQEDFQETAVRPVDKNLDGSICLKIMWGEELNPNANWFGVEQFLPRDNNANASKT